jgi:hypothetical protein
VVPERRALAIGAVVFGVVTGLEEPFHALSNGLTLVSQYERRPG